MPTPFASRRTARSAATRGSQLTPFDLDAEWRCTQCHKLLGMCRDGRMHLRFTRGHEYFVGFPVQATCRGCGTLNQRASAS